MKLVDASAWIHFLRRKGDSLVKRRVADLLRRAEAAHTCPSWFEILAAGKPEEEGDVRAAFSLSERIYFGAEHWEHAAGIERRARAKGLLIPRNDIFVAAVAIENKLTLVCRDSHFEMLKAVSGGKLRTEQVEIVGE
jgi:predicted nucleic acid-binding protein